MNYESTQEIELAIAQNYGWKQNLIVPNISWGLLDYEADIIIMSKAGIVTEIEIKTSRSDLIADSFKSHKHKSNLVKYLYFAIPRKLEKSISYIQENAGIYIVETNGNVKKERNATTNPDFIKLKKEQRYNLARLGTMRIWNLKQRLHESIQSYKNFIKAFENKNMRVKND